MKRVLIAVGLLGVWLSTMATAGGSHAIGYTLKRTNHIWELVFNSGGHLLKPANFDTCIVDLGDFVPPFNGGVNDQYEFHVAYSNESAVGDSVRVVVCPSFNDDASDKWNITYSIPSTGNAIPGGAFSNTANSKGYDVLSFQPLTRYYVLRIFVPDSDSLSVANGHAYQVRLQFGGDH